MRIERYIANDTRTAMAQVRAELGPDALILANRKVGGRVELTAAVDVDEAVERAAAPRQEPRRPASRDPANELQLKALENELQRLRGILEQELGGRGWRDSAGVPAPAAALRQRLLRLGLSRTLSGQIMDRLPAFQRLEQGWELALAALARQLPTLAGDQDPEAVTALFGSTGVGKTSTIAKMAGRDILRYGVDKVGLITLDSYRIGAQEQLASFADALGLPLHTADDSHSLSLALRELRGRRVYIDTAGMGHQDPRMQRQLDLINAQRRDVTSLLVLSASAQPAQSAAMARLFAPSSLSGAIICKLDEALSLGGVLDVLLRSRLPLHSVTDGQRVPEDLAAADGLALVRRAAALLEPEEPSAQALSAMKAIA